MTNVLGINVDKLKQCMHAWRLSLPPLGKVRQPEIKRNRRHDQFEVDERSQYYHRMCDKVLNAHQEGYVNDHYRC